MPSNRFRSTTFAEAGQALGKGLSGFGAALEAIGERNALQAETLAFGDLASLLQKASLSDNPEEYDSLVFRGYNTLKTPSLVNSWDKMVGGLNRPLTKQQKADKKALEEYERKETASKTLEAKISIVERTQELSAEGIQAKAFARKQELDKNAFDLKAAEQRLANATTTADRLLAQEKIDLLKEEAKLDPDKQADIDFAREVTSDPSNYSKALVEASVALSPNMDRAMRQAILDSAGTNIVSKQDKLDLKIALNETITPEKRYEALVRLGQDKNIQFLTPPKKPTLVEGREQLKVDLGRLIGQASEHGKITTASRNTIRDRIVALQASLIAIGVARLLSTEAKQAKEDILALQKVIGGVIEDTTISIPDPTLSLDDTIDDDGGGIEVSQELRNIIELEIQRSLHTGVSDTLNRAGVSMVNADLMAKMSQSIDADPSGPLAQELDSILGDNWNPQDLIDLIADVRNDTTGISLRNSVLGEE